MTLRSWTTRAVAASAAVAAALSIPGAAAEEPAAVPLPAGAWTVDLTLGSDDSGLQSEDGALRLDPATAEAAASSGAGLAQGVLVTGRQYLDAPTSVVLTALDADVPDGSAVLVDVRGLLADGRWTEWTPVAPDAPADLAAEVRRVQGRVILTGEDGVSPVVREVRFAPGPAPPGLPDLLPKAPETFRVFATREGLVGGTTANGHVIRPRDHFVALPSRRGLSPRGTGDYSVTVCADNGRCEWAPVWDVGPWNTTDDYWNDSVIRQSWQDLAKGVPQAQAAFQDGYNGGRDQFGRRVANPAGIDLADGTFWDGLGLRDNAWVTVTYLWTETGPLGTVRTGMLNVRSGPGTEHPVVGLAAQHARMAVECTVVGQPVSGLQGTTDMWLRVGPDQYVSAAHVALAPGAGPC